MAGPAMAMATRARTKRRTGQDREKYPRPGLASPTPTHETDRQTGRQAGREPLPLHSQGPGSNHEKHESRAEQGRIEKTRQC